MLGAAVAGLLVSVTGVWMLQPHRSPSPSPMVAVSQNVAAGSSMIRPSAQVASSQPTLVERAEKGELKALEEIDRQSDEQRSIDEALAWAHGKTVRKHRALEALGKKLCSDLPLSADARTLNELRPFTEDPRTATEALAILASLQTPMATDLLYEVWVKKRESTDEAQLAKRLLYTKQVRESASDALAVALDLRAATTCQAFAEILPRAHQKGDMRSLHLLGNLGLRYGCGPSGNQDCYPCLRQTTALKDAISEVRLRPAPEI